MKKFEHSTYDDGTYKTIRKFMNQGKYEKALFLLNKYLGMYPEDYWARLEYVRILKRNNQLQEAFYQISLLLTMNHDMDSNDSFYQFVILEIFNLHLRMCHYQEAYDYLPKVKEINKKLEKSDKEEIRLNELFLKSRLGLLEKTEPMDYSHAYLASQIVHYSEYKALNHILKHNCADYMEENHDIIEDEIYIKGLFDRMKNLVESAIPLYSDNFANIYFFEYPDISNVILKDGYPYKYLKVAAFRDTKEIITIYPIFSKERIKIVNSLKEQEKKKVKQMSQIEKFNHRYDKKQ